MRVKPYEREVLAMLCADKLPQSVLYAAINEPTSISCKFTGAGYYLDLAHPDLPTDRIVCDTPNVVGIFQGREIGFIVFIENQTISLECYGYGSHGIPEEIRQGTIEVSAT